MQYRVEELAAACGVKVDTVRFYQGRGLIPPPERRGRNAVYGDGHLARIREIRSLRDEGFTLAQIRRISATGSAPASGESATQTAASDSQLALLAALAEERAEARSLTRSELAAEAGVPDALIVAVEEAGLIESTLSDSGGEAHYSSADAEMLRTGLALLGAGFPLARLLQLASDHARHIRALSESGIDLFDDHIRKQTSEGDDPEVVAAAFRELLPQVTRLVALHFQRTLVNRAIERLRAKGEGPALEQALAAVEAARRSAELKR